MDVADYLKRIGFAGSAAPDLATLTAIVQAHVSAVPFENVDVQLGRPLDTSVERAFDKIVNRRRGGWCYEMNGVLGWALRELGFDVTRIAAGVMRETMGDAQMGNHLALIVTLDRRYLVDGGFGSALWAPLPMALGERWDEPFAVSLRAEADGYWRFNETLHGSPFSFDFRDAAADEALLAAKCAWQQSHPASPFVQNVVAQKRESARVHLTMRGRVFTRNDAERAHKRVIETREEWLALMRDVFGIDEKEMAGLWPAICQRHDELFPNGA